MLQRAASNAYSWWWASHIRTKQSKWLEQNLQDLEEKVAYTLKLIEEDGDSFAKRAEMYYKKRPELIAFVEEAYRAYRALAERYDHISTELQNANNTIAAVFPDQVHFVDEDDEDASPRVIKRSDIQKGNIPNVPKAPLKDLRSVVTTATRLTSATKKLRPSKSRKAAAIVAKSGLTKDEGLKEIGNLQKKILALQTEKEFVKSSYEDKLAKYWDIENKIKEMQGRVYRLQDEFGAGIVIEDEEARTLMASTALKSCQETLTKLKEKHEGSAEEAKVEPKKIKDTQGKLQSIQDELSSNETSQTRPSAEDDSVKAVEGSTTQGGEELGPSQEKIKEQLEVGFGESLTMEEMAEKIDELVNKVVSLDTAFSSQTSLIERLQTETNELQTQIQILEGEKATLINGKNELSNKLVMMEENLQRLQGLNGNVKDQNNYLQTFSTEAHSPQFNAEKLQSLKSDEEIQHSSEKEDKSTFQGKLQETDGHEGALNPNDAPEILQNVKLPEESEVKPLWEKDKTPQKEMSTNQVKSQKEIDGQESDSNDGLQRQQSVKLPESEVKPSSEKDKTPQKEEMSTIQAKPQKEIDGQESELNSNDDLQIQQSARLPEKSEVEPSSEKDKTPKKEETSTIQVKLQKEIDGQESELNSNDDLHRQQSVKLPEESEVEPLSEQDRTPQKEETSTIQVKLQKEIDGQESESNSNDDLQRQQGVKLPEESEVEPSSEKDRTPQKEKKPTIQVKLQKEIDGQESELNSNDDLQRQQSVKLPEESEVEPSSEKDKTPQKEETSTIQVKSQKEIDRRESEVDSNDGLQRQQSVKLLEESEVKPLGEKDKTPQKEEMSTIQVESQKEIDGQEGEMDSNNGLQRQQSVKLLEEHEVQNSSEKEKTSPVEVQFQKQLEGSECAPKLADDKQQCEKPNEEFKVSGCVQTEVAKHTKERDLSTIPGNQGEVSSQPQSNIEPCNLLERSPDQMTQEKVDNQASSQAPDNSLNVEREEQETEPGDEPDGKKMLNGPENREKVLLTEHTKVSQNYMELKKKLDEEGIQTGEEGIKTGENTFEIKRQLEELRSANAKKDEEIRALREKLRILQALADNDNNLDDQCAEQKVTVSETPRTTTEEEDIKVIPVDQSQTTSAIEEKFRMSIDELLEENLDFWLRFSTTFHQIQKFETEVKDLEVEVSKVQDRKKKHSDSSSIKYSLRSDIRPLYNHLREIQTELALWMEKSALLKEELTDRFSSLCNIQEEITGALRLSAEDYDFKFTSYQAAKFQGEVLNMKQENNKVADELQAGLDHVTTLQIDLEKTLTSLSEEFGLAESKSDSNIELDHADSKTRVPLRSFIFGVKPKKQKSSFLSCMHPALAKKYNGLRSGSSR